MVTIESILESSEEKRSIINTKILLLELNRYPFARYSGFHYNEIIESLIDSELFSEEEIEYLKDYFRIVIKCINF